jgi:hypothetical protein
MSYNRLLVSDLKTEFDRKFVDILFRKLMIHLVNVYPATKGKFEIIDFVNDMLENNNPLPALKINTALFSDDEDLLSRFNKTLSKQGFILCSLTKNNILKEAVVLIPQQMFVTEKRKYLIEVWTSDEA